MKLAEIKNLHESSNENKDIGKAPSVGADELGDTLSSAQVAKMGGVSQSRVRQWHMDGDLKAKETLKGRRDLRFNRSAVEAFLKKDREITGRPEGS